MKLFRSFLFSCLFVANNPATATQYAFERAEKNFVDYCNVAKRNRGKDRFVFINSWNEFQKGNTLELRKEYTTEFLIITKQELKKQ